MCSTADNPYAVLPTVPYILNLVVLKSGFFEDLKQSFGPLGQVETFSVSGKQEVPAFPSLVAFRPAQMSNCAEGQLLLTAHEVFLANSTRSHLFVETLRSLGRLGEDLKAACRYIDPRRDVDCR